MSSLADPVATAGMNDPDRPFAVTRSRHVTYGEMHTRVASAAATLRRLGAGSGERVALQLESGTEEGVIRAVTAILAAWRAGAVAMLIAQQAPAGTIGAVVDQVGGAVVVEPGALGEHTGRTEHDTDASMWRPEQRATILLTSGSSGPPKAVLHTLGNHVASARGWHERLPAGACDRWLLSLPLHHVAGLGVLVRTVLAGASLAIPERGQPLAEAVETLKVTRAAVVSTQLRRALSQDAPRTLESVLVGGSAVPATVLRDARRAGWPVMMSYGLTEMASTVSATPLGASDEILGTSGRVLPGREVRLSDHGEILVRGAVRFAGYVTSAGLAEPFCEEGWFATGDLGEWEHIDGEPMLRVIGRRDNMLVSGGENIHPEAIEAVLLGDQSVEQAVVVAVPHEEFGERPVAFVRSVRWEPERWRERIAAALPRFMLPDAFHPMPASGDAGHAKPGRAELTRLAREYHQRKGGA